MNLAYVRCPQVCVYHLHKLKHLLAVVYGSTLSDHVQVKRDRRCTAGLGIGEASNSFLAFESEQHCAITDFTLVRSFEYVCCQPCRFWKQVRLVFVFITNTILAAEGAAEQPLFADFGAYSQPQRRRRARARKRPMEAPRPRILMV